MTFARRPFRIFTNERAAQLLEREARRERLLLGERAAVHAAQEVVEQALAGRGVVEDVADERRLAGLLDEVAQALGRGGEAFEEEGVDRGVARRQLRGVEVPALVVAVDERVADVVGVQAASARCDSAAARVRPMRARHDVRRAVGEPEPGAGVGDLHHVPREVARGMVHALVRRGDVAARGVVVGAEVRGDGAAARGVEEARQVRLAALAEDRLRRLDHELEPQRAGGEAEARLERVEDVGEQRDLLGELDLRQRDDEVRAAARRRSRRGASVRKRSSVRMRAARSSCGEAA